MNYLDLLELYKKAINLAEGLLNEEFSTGVSGMMDAQPNPVVGYTSIKKQRKGKQKRGQLGYKYIKIRPATLK